MSHWSDNPEFFDEWIEKQALAGRLGSIVQQQVEGGEIRGYQLWDIVSPALLVKLSHEADEAYFGRWKRE